LEKLLDAKKRLISTNKMMIKTSERVQRMEKELESISGSNTE
jgi:hypothetical protein